MDWSMQINFSLVVKKGKMFSSTNTKQTGQLLAQLKHSLFKYWANNSDDFMNRTTLKGSRKHLHLMVMPNTRFHCSPSKKIKVLHSTNFSDTSQSSIWRFPYIAFKLHLQGYQYFLHLGFQTNYKAQYFYKTKNSNNSWSIWNWSLSAYPIDFQLPHMTSALCLCYGSRFFKLFMSLYDLIQITSKRQSIQQNIFWCKTVGDILLRCSQKEWSLMFRVLYRVRQKYS